MRCVIIGNGPSRKLLPLDQIPYTTFGCNQIYHDFQPDYLLAQDREVLHQMREDRMTEPVWVAQESYRRYHEDTYTKCHDMREIRFPYYRMNSWFTGEQAIVLAAQKGFTHMDLIAFDGGPVSMYREERVITHPTVDRYLANFKKILEYYPKIRINISVDNRKAH